MAAKDLVLMELDSAAYAVEVAKLAAGNSSGAEARASIRRQMAQARRHMDSVEEILARFDRRDG